MMRRIDASAVVIYTDEDKAEIAAKVCQACGHAQMLMLDLFLLFDVPVLVLQQAIALAQADGRLLREHTAGGDAYETRFGGVDIDAAHRKAVAA